MSTKATDFKWEQWQGVTDDPIESHNVIQSQVSIMQRLFKPTKRPDTLAAWHKRRFPDDLHLYAAFGLIEPVEYEYLLHHLDRWHAGLIEDALTRADNGEDMSGTMLPAKRVSNLLQAMASQNFDRHEGLLLRMEKPVRLVGALIDKLYLENARLNHSESVNAVDELMCQETYPTTEFASWLWMNKMVANRSKSPLEMSLKETDEALKQLNEFQLYRTIADIHNYGLEPISTQRVNGQLADCLFPRRMPRIHAALLFLRGRNLLNGPFLDKMLRMSPKEQDQEELRLKRNTVSAFLTDIARAAPDSIWLTKMVTAFGVYFSAILEQIGVPTLGSKRVCVAGANGKAQFAHVIDVSFSNPGSSKDKVPPNAIKRGNTSNISR